ncbi:MAG: bifunctional oligoribonuclease/PAP phosphatase NrnA [Planctomycetota bacterium]|nr:MAG: bifunctional oligoribonuclease/PAP phosphatase NrnA [Planctomycetota bacterium]
MNRSENLIRVPSVPPAVIDALRACRSPLMIAHVVPDADALGSALALARACASSECEAKVLLPSGSLSQKLAFLPEWSDVPIVEKTDLHGVDALVVLDTARKSRCNVGETLKETDWSAGRRLLNIDHHATNTNFGDVNWVDPEAGSTSELVYYLLRAGGWPVDATTASLLYGGIQTDTSGFSLATTTPAALQAAAELAARGARIADLGERLFRSHRKSEFDLLRVIYANTKLLDGGVSYSSASYEEIHGAGCTAADIDDQVNVPRSLDGVRLAMLFTEGVKGKTRINFRASGSVTVVELAVQFGGGGHAQSAGAVLDCGLQEAIDRVLPRALEHVRKFPP